jgi:3'5'-cyclic nucleotide phosphodiesterase
VEAKGKGKLQTYWLLLKDDLTPAASASRSPGSISDEDSNVRVEQRPGEHMALDPSTSASNSPAINGSQRIGWTPAEQSGEANLPPKVQRLVKWNVEILAKLLKQIVAKRNAVNSRKVFDAAAMSQAEADLRKKIHVLDEVVEIIPLPAFDRQVHRRQEDPNQIDLPAVVLDQLTGYVSKCASMYRDNAFHSFDHVSHVAMSVSKLLSRIVSADDAFDDENGTAIGIHGNNNHNNNNNNNNHFRKAHDHTYGITSDPMTQFSVVLAALIHDVDHLGVSNSQLIQEGHELAGLFRNKSIAEQNSIVLAWDALMAPRFADLRRCIYSTPYELSRFRQLVTNTVLATDIFDKDLSALRRDRWRKAFQIDAPDGRTPNGDSDEEATNRKATIVMEHLIQASDVAHTMQHWHVYRKWNERLFVEMTVAHRNGRLQTNPADNWYNGEIGFFDNYVIPLAKKLQECGVFGVSSDEYLNYAVENRREWANSGEDVVREFVARYQADLVVAEPRQQLQQSNNEQQQQQSEHEAGDINKILLPAGVTGVPVFAKPPTLKDHRHDGADDGEVTSHRKPLSSKFSSRNSIS